MFHATQTACKDRYTVIHRTISTFSFVKNCYLLTPNSYITSSLAIAVHDEYMQLRYTMCTMSPLSS